MSEQTETKRGRGRPKGSTSCANITLEELSQIFSKDQVIPVGRKFLQERNIQIAPVQTSPVAVVQEKSKPTTGGQVSISVSAD